MVREGGTEYSIIREAFLSWDADRSHMLDAQEFVDAMRTLGLDLTHKQVAMC
jgi:Ca2+-binding EF-hand superfamily protein